VRIVKNKVSPPFRVAEFDIMNDGISKEAGILDVGVELGLIAKSGAFLKHNNQILGQGREAAKLHLKENPKLTKELLEQIWKHAKTGKMPVAVGKEEEEE